MHLYQFSNWPFQLLLDEPTNHLDMESIDALAKAVNDFKGGMVLVSHDMRLISQVANEIWICDNKTITQYKGDILNFKMQMRAQMGIDSDDKKLKGDASVKQGAAPPKEKKVKPKPQPKLEVIKPKAAKETSLPSPASTTDSTPALAEPKRLGDGAPDDATAVTASTTATSNSGGTSSTTSGAAAPKKYVPPHLRKKMSS